MTKQTYPIVATPAQARAGLRGINREMRLYLIPCGDGVTCLGYENARKKTAAVAEWLGRPDLAPPVRRGTAKAFAAYLAAMAAGAAHHKATGQRATFELTPALIGLEGARVEVTGPDGYRERFNVGKSTGWAPCHLEIANRRSSGGGAAFIPQGGRVSVIRARA